eukprot:4593116-Heterocapsa_arctica.AAC.1
MGHNVRRSTGHAAKEAQGQQRLRSVDHSSRNPEHIVLVITVLIVNAGRHALQKRNTYSGDTRPPNSRDRAAKRQG